MGRSLPVHPITTQEANRLAKRPAYSVLSNGALTQAGLALPHWKEALALFMRSVEKEGQTV